MSVRIADYKDLGIITELWHEMMLFHISRDSIYKMKENAKEIYQGYVIKCLNDPQKVFFVFEEKGRVKGYILAEISSLPPVYEESKIGIITEICVEENKRKSGIGKLLLAKAEGWFKEKGIFRTECTISVNNAVSQSFWKNNGYVGYNETCFKYL